MLAEVINTERFKRGCASYLAMLMFTSGDEVNDADTEDVSKETLAYVAGEVFMICKKLVEMDLWANCTTDAVSSLCHSMAGQHTGSGVGLYDNPAPWPLCEDDIDVLDAWQRERHGHRTAELYLGDDGKVYIFGHEHEKPTRLKMSLSKGPGRFGFMESFAEDAVSVADLAVRTAYRILSEDWKSRWIVGFEETPL